MVPLSTLIEYMYSNYSRWIARVYVSANDVHYDNFISFYLYYIDKGIPTWFAEMPSFSCAWTVILRQMISDDEWRRDIMMYVWHGGDSSFMVVHEKRSSWRQSEWAQMVPPESGFKSDTRNNELRGFMCSSNPNARQRWSENILCGILLEESQENITELWKVWRMKVR